jgi:uncharacterized protein
MQMAGDSGRARCSPLNPREAFLFLQVRLDHRHYCEPRFTRAAGYARFMTSNAAVMDRLCLACGLCCNGVLFKDVELQAGDDPMRLRSLSKSLRIRNSKLTQPCAVLGRDCRCGIYAERPVRCRQFECALLQSATKGDTPLDAALRLIREARQRARTVLGLLRELGDHDEHLALSVRFERTKKRLDSDLIDGEMASHFAELSLAVHNLNVLLSQRFYPGHE